MLRMGLALLVGGGFLAFFGMHEYQDGSGVSVEPVSATIVDIQKGQIPDRHLSIGSHVAMYESCYVFFLSDDEDEESLDIPDDADLTRTYYPIVTPEAFREFDACFDAQGELIPGREPLLKVAAIVKCNKFNYGRDLPDLSEYAPEIKGMVIQKLSSEDKEALTWLANDPSLSIDSANVVMLEENDRPMPLAICISTMVAGLALLFGGVGVLGKAFLAT